MSNLIARNITSSSIVVSGYRVFSIDSTDVEVVIVENTSSHDRRNAFKYTENGTSYWYVVGINHIGWVSDLSTIGYEEYSPAVVLPTVTLDNWTLPDTASGTSTIQSGSTEGAGKAGAYPREKIVFDNSCVYATTFWRHANNTFAGRVEIAPVNDSGYIGLYNTTNQALEVYWVNYATCSDSTSTVVMVYDSKNDAYNAFKYTVSGTDYWYVLDGTQTDWTDDLSSIGYSNTPAPVLPTVNTNAGWVAIYPNHNNFAPGSVRAGRVWDYASSQWVVSSYDLTKTYAAINWSAENSRSGFYGIRISEYNGQIGLENVLADTIYRYIESQYATCDSTDATVVCVYGNGFIYNAFKFTSGANDYYYVLDGVQTEWIVSLNAIGYELFDPNEIEILIGFKWNDDNTELVAVSDLSNDYYWSRIVSQRDRDILSSIGLASSIQSYTKYGCVAYLSGYTYTFIAIYSDMGETVATGHNPSYCIIRSYSSGPAIMGLYYSAYSDEYVMTWKCRITRNS